MPLDQNDVALIVDTVKEVVDRVIAERMEQVYAVLEETREQMQQTVLVLEGNDQALLGEIRKVAGGDVAGFALEMGEAWGRFIETEAARLGMTRPTQTAVKKKARPRDETGEAASDDD